MQRDLEHKLVIRSNFDNSRIFILNFCYFGFWRPCLVGPNKEEKAFIVAHFVA